MKKIFIAIILILVVLLLSTAVSPIMVLAEDAEEGISLRDVSEHF